MARKKNLYYCEHRQLNGYVGPNLDPTKWGPLTTLVTNGDSREEAHKEIAQKVQKEQGIEVNPEDVSVCWMKGL